MQYFVPFTDIIKINIYTINVTLKTLLIRSHGEREVRMRSHPNLKLASFGQILHSLERFVLLSVHVQPAMSVSQIFDLDGAWLF